MIRTEGLTKVYESKSGRQEALQDVEVRGIRRVLLQIQAQALRQKIQQVQKLHLRRRQSKRILTTSMDWIQHSILMIL